MHPFSTWKILFKSGCALYTYTNFFLKFYFCTTLPTPLTFLFLHTNLLQDGLQPFRLLLHKHPVRDMFRKNVKREGQRPYLLHFSSSFHVLPAQTTCRRGAHYLQEIESFFFPKVGWLKTTCTLYMLLHYIRDFSGI